MSRIKDVQQIKVLIAEGKKKGFLTFEEVNKALPADLNKSEQIEEIISIFDQLDIAIVDEKVGKAMAAPGLEEAETKDGERLKLAESDESPDYPSRSSDPVRMYL